MSKLLNKRVTSLLSESGLTEEEIALVSKVVEKSTENTTIATTERAIYDQVMNMVVKDKWNWNQLKLRTLGLTTGNKK